MPTKGNRRENEIDHLVVRNRVPNDFSSGSADFAIQIALATAHGFEP